MEEQIKKSLELFEKIYFNGRLNLNGQEFENRQR